MPAEVILKYGSKGVRVKNLQKLLNDNTFWEPRRELKVDGEFGSLTSAAVQKAKYFLGYSGDAEPVAGEMFIESLSKKRPLTDAMLLRRKDRMKRAEAAQKEQSAETKMRLAALKVIKGELGTLEKPNNSNHIKYNDFWGWGPVPYCMIFISWAWLLVGSDAFKRGVRWAGCREMLADAKRGVNGIHLTNDPDPGCPGVIDLYGDARVDHAITFVKDNGNGTCQTVEGNTSKDGTYIQGVFKKTRKLSDCFWFDIER